MRTIRHISLLLILLTILSFRKSEEKYTIDFTYSSVYWACTKPAGVENGYVKFKSGVINMNNNEPVSAQFIIDMSTISVKSQTNETLNKRLVTHLKSTDFFAVATYPTAKIQVHKFVQKKPTIYMASGSLTIKGKTNPVEFPVSFDIVKSKLVADAHFKIDRTKWGIIYNSKNVMSSLADGFIYNDIGFTVVACMNKQP